VSGRRCKTLRREFRAAHGRAPGGVEIRHWGRRMEGRNKSGRLRQLLFGAGLPATLSEWRRVKRAYVRRNAA
jgi:hypothetical protein